MPDFDVGSALTGLLNDFNASQGTPLMRPGLAQGPTPTIRGDIANPYGGRPGVSGSLEVPIATDTSGFIQGSYHRPFVEEPPEWSARAGIRRRF